MADQRTAEFFLELSDVAYCADGEHKRGPGGYCSTCGINMGPPRPPQAQCQCGRFAKFLRVEHYYNGNWNCERMDVDCARCGVVGIELV